MNKWIFSYFIIILFCEISRIYIRTTFYLLYLKNNFDIIRSLANLKMIFSKHYRDK